MPSKVSNIYTQGFLLKIKVLTGMHAFYQDCPIQVFQCYSHRSCFDIAGNPKKVGGVDPQIDNPAKTD